MGLNATCVDVGTEHRAFSISFSFLPSLGLLFILRSGGAGSAAILGSQSSLCLQSYCLVCSRPPIILFIPVRLPPLCLYSYDHHRRDNLAFSPPYMDFVHFKTLLTHIYQILGRGACISCNKIPWVLSGCYNITF